METEILIVGAGLAGLSLANHLQDLGKDFLISEAGRRVGGRVLSSICDGVPIDLGPAWIWPGQRRIERLVEKLGLEVFPQYSEGAGVFQNQAGAIQAGVGIGSMQGSIRISGGIDCVIQRLVRSIQQDRILTDCAVSEISSGRKLTAVSDGGNISADRIVVALPPRIAARDIRFLPGFSDATLAAMRAIPTWMAGHAKLVAVYDTAPWRNAGLSGDVISQAGPLAEIHDASPAGSSGYAVMGFFGAPVTHRRNRAGELKTEAIQQLTDIFGTDMASPRGISLHDWALDPLIATDADHSGPVQHPRYGLPTALSGLMNGRLFFSSSEMGQQYGGFIEGALEAAEATARAVLN